MAVQLVITFCAAFGLSALLFRVRHRELQALGSAPWICLLCFVNATGALILRTLVVAAIPTSSPLGTSIATGLAALGPAIPAVGYGPSNRSPRRINLQGNAVARRIDRLVVEKNAARNARRVPERARLLAESRTGERTMLGHPTFDEYLYYLRSRNAAASAERKVRQIASDELDIEQRLAVLLTTMAKHGDWEFYRDQLSAARKARRRNKRQSG